MTHGVCARARDYPEMVGRLEAGSERWFCCDIREQAHVFGEEMKRDASENGYMSELVASLPEAVDCSRGRARPLNYSPSTFCRVG